MASGRPKRARKAVVQFNATEEQKEAFAVKAGAGITLGDFEFITTMVRTQNLLRLRCLILMCDTWACSRHRCAKLLHVGLSSRPFTDCSSSVRERHGTSDQTSSPFQG